MQRSATCRKACGRKWPRAIRHPGERRNERAGIQSARECGAAGKARAGGGCAWADRIDRGMDYQAGRFLPLVLGGVFAGARVVTRFAWPFDATAFDRWRLGNPDSASAGIGDASALAGAGVLRADSFLRNE